MASFSGFLTNYNGGSLNTPNNLDSSLTDIMSNVILVPTQNTAVGHNGNDGFIFIMGLLIQFSTDTTFTVSNELTGENTFTYPIKYQANNLIYNILLSPIRCSSGKTPNIGIFGVPTATSFVIQVRINPGNFTWISIGKAPNIPIYTEITSNSINWKSVACSGNGKFVIGCASTSSPLRVSNCYGYGNGTTFGSWSTSTTPSLLWNNVAVNNSGQYMVASQSSVNRYYYSVNYGVTWTQNATATYPNPFLYITMNGDGSRLVAVANDGFYTGNLVSFSELSLLTNQVINGRCIASDYTGQYLVLGSTTNIYTSNNYGLNWTTSIDGSWKQVVSNSTGQYLVAIKTTSDNIYISNNFGISWTTNTSPLSQTWIDIAIDSSGQYMKAVYSGEYPFYSNNYGVNWTILSSSSYNTVVSNFTWSAICSNSTGAFSVLCRSSSNNPYVSFNSSS